MTHILPPLWYEKIKSAKAPQGEFWRVADVNDNRVTQFDTESEAYAFVMAENKVYQGVGCGNFLAALKDGRAPGIEVGFKGAP